MKPGPFWEVTRMRRDELSEEQGRLLQGLLPENGKRGGQRKDHRPILNGISLGPTDLWASLPTQIPTSR